MTTDDNRWLQRFANFETALASLTEDLTILKTRPFSKLEEKGIIQAFEYTYELAWNCLKDLFEQEADMNIFGSRDAIRLAFRRGVIENGEVWMDMVKSRTLTSHTYHKELAENIAKKIIENYHPEFLKLQETLHKIKNRK